MGSVKMSRKVEFECAKTLLELILFHSVKFCLSLAINSVDTPPPLLDTTPPPINIINGVLTYSEKLENRPNHCSKCEHFHHWYTLLLGWGSPWRVFDRLDHSACNSRFVRVPCTAIGTNLTAPGTGHDRRPVDLECVSRVPVFRQTDALAFEFEKLDNPRRAKCHKLMARDIEISKRRELDDTFRGIRRRKPLSYRQPWSMDSNFTAVLVEFCAFRRLCHNCYPSREPWTIALSPDECRVLGVASSYPWL